MPTNNGLLVHISVRQWFCIALATSSIFFMREYKGGISLDVFRSYPDMKESELNEDQLVSSKAKLCLSSLCFIIRSIIQIGFRKISWFVSVNNWSAHHDILVHLVNCLFFLFLSVCQFVCLFILLLLLLLFFVFVFLCQCAFFKLKIWYE